MSKSLKQMAYDTIEAHQETIADLRTQLAKANERVEELGKENSEYAKCIISISERVDIQDFIKNNPNYENARAQLNKFAIDKKIEVLHSAIGDFEEIKSRLGDDIVRSSLVAAIGYFRSKIDQLRKEQE